MRNLPRFLRLFAAGVLLVLAARGADDVRKNYDLPAGDAAERLKQFAEISGRETLFAAEAVRGVQTTAVRGELTAQQALEKMLERTGLLVVRDQKTGAFAVKKGSADPNAPRVVLKEAATPANPAKIEDGKLVLETYQVTGSRLRANSGEIPTQPVLSLTSLDIERMGVSNLGQLFQYIPAVTSYTTGLGTESVDGSTTSGFATGQSSSRTSAQLRGGSQTETLLLVDGRRVPLTGLRNAGGNGYDLGGIPLAAIERVEVLLDGASAIYGADAINGVINVILKKHYSGTELRFNYDNTFDGDAAVKTVSLTHGFATGKWSGLLTFSASENNIMLLADRYLTQSFNRQVYGGTVDQSQPTLYVGGTGSLNVASGNLPGTSTPRVSIPANYAGGAITVADYLAAPAPVGGLTPGRQGATNYSRDQSAYFRLAYEFNERLTLSAMARLGHKQYHDNGQWRRIDNATIPVGQPGNPFSVPVRLSKIFYDLPPIISGSETRNNEFSLSATGKLPGDWRYEATLTYLQGRNFMRTPDLPGAGGQVGVSTAPSSTFTSRLNAALAAGSKPVLIYDSNTQSPNAADSLDPFWVSTTQSRLNDRVTTWTHSAQADGNVFSLPAGEVKAVVGAELREEYVAFPNSLGGQVWAFLPQRDVMSFYAEARVPVLGRNVAWPLARQLDFNLAVRTEDYSDFGRATTPRYGVAWRPFRSLLLRGSYGEGFLAPQLYRIAQVTSTVSLPWTTIAPGAVDYSRGGTAITGTATVMSGGNPSLRPQLSQNATAGVVLDVPRIPGLSLSVDFYDNRFTSAFGSIGNIMDRQVLAPETIFRGDKLPTDPADWLGPITGYDARTINIASTRSVGYSFGLRYARATPWGDFTINSSGEKTVRREERLLPTSAPTATVHRRYVPMRITTALFWSRGPWEAGVTGVYGGEYWMDTTNAALAPSGYTADVMRWDLNASYDFGKQTGFGAKGDAWWKRPLHDTRLRLTIINLFNREPAVDVRGTFSSLVIDPRLRRYVIDVTKRF